MKEIIISLLKPFANLCYKFATAVSVQTALVIYILVLAALVVWVMTLKKEKPGRYNHGKILLLRDLRFWAVSILLMQAVIYIIFR
jgi:hypothetical protein